MADAPKRVKLTRSIILGGKHADADSTHDVPAPLAHRLVGEGSAEHVTKDGEKPEVATSVNRMQTADNADPKTEEVAPAPAKVKGAK